MANSLFIYNFKKVSSMHDWVVVNDEVMGGISNGKYYINTDGNGVFSGHVSLENNGGFSLVKHTIPLLNVSEYSNFQIRLKGDGDTFQFRCKATSNERHSFIFEIITNGEWQTVLIPFKEMYPAFRGKTLDLPNYQGKQLAEIAFLIGNKKEQDFSLLLNSIQIN